MKAAVRDRYGPPEIVEVREIPTPEPAAGEVLVRIRAASVNRADLDGLYPRWTWLKVFTGLRRPRHQQMGVDIAGTVEAVGEGATLFQPGDDVFAELVEAGQGGLAEYVRAAEEHLEAKPADLSFEEAAALPHSGVLAYQSLRTRRGRSVGEGRRVLIVGASGNVGPFAVQIAKSRGAHVTAVTSAAKFDFVRSLGADEVIDYAEVDYRRPAERYDWIVDVDARQSLVSWRHALKPGGLYAALGGPASWLLSSMLLGPILKLVTGRQMGLMLWWKPFNRPDLNALLELIAAGKVRPVVDRVYPLDQVVEALRRVDGGQSRGKVIVTP